MAATKLELIFDELIMQLWIFNQEFNKLQIRKEAKFIVMHPETLRKAADQIPVIMYDKEGVLHKFQGCEIIRSFDIPEGEFRIG